MPPSRPVTRAQALAVMRRHRQKAIALGNEALAHGAFINSLSSELVQIELQRMLNEYEFAMSLNLGPGVPDYLAVQSGDHERFLSAEDIAFLDADVNRIKEKEAKERRESEALELEEVSDTCLAAIKKKGSNACRVRIVKPYVKPNVPDAPPEETSQKNDRRRRRNSPLESAPMPPKLKKLMKHIVNSKEFRSQSRQIWLDSRKQPNPRKRPKFREMGALAAYYNRETNTIDIYSVGRPNPDKANAMKVSLVEEAGRALFLWHPHPWENEKPSVPDLNFNFKHDVAGVIRFGDSIRDRTYFISREKSR